MLRRALTLAFLGGVLAPACAIGEMSQADPIDAQPGAGGDDADTPLTTGADDDGSGDDGGGAEGTTDGGLPPDDDGADTSGVTDDGGDESTGAVADDGADTAGGDTGRDADTGAETSGGDDAAGESSGGDTGSMADAIDVSGWRLVQTASDRTITIPEGTLLPAGAYLVVGRVATRAAFEAHWGPLPEDAVYLVGADLDPLEFPTINGDETFELRDAENGTLDGPTPPLALGGNAQRVDPGEPAALAASWISSADPDAAATPGDGQDPSPLFSGVYVSEMSDAPGNGNYVYEFVELFHDP